MRCTDWIGAGDIFCKHCGYKFNHSDVQEMTTNSTFIKRWNAPFHGPFDELQKCKICECFNAASYKYCKRCGYEFSDEEKDRMKSNGVINYNESIKYGLIFFTICIVAITIFFTFLK